MTSWQAATQQDCLESQPDLEDLFRTHYARIVKVIERITRNPGRAEELAVEVFLRWAGRRDPDIDTSPAWLFRAAIHLALDESRLRMRRERLAQFLPGIQKTPDPEETLHSSDQRRRVVEVLSRLNRRDAELLLMRAEGLSYEELGSISSLNPASIGKFLSRAQQAFRKEYLKRYGKHE